MSDIRRWASGELFPTDAPLAPSEMIGRTDDVDRMALALTGATNLVVAGPRRTGKTTVCDAALDVCRGEGCYVVAIDLWKLPDAAALAEAITIQALANRPLLARAIEGAARTGRALWDALSEAATIRAHQDLTGGAIDLQLTLVPQRARKEPARALRSALELLDRIAVADDVPRMVVSFDEFQEIASGLYGDVDVVTRQIRATLQRSRRVSTVFAGSIEHLMRELFAPGERALSQFGAFFELSPIVAEQWRDGVRARVALDHTTITDSALQLLIDTGEGHARSTMLLAQQSHAIAVRDLVHEIDDAIVREALMAGMRGERLKHDQTLREIRTLGRNAQTLAERVAAGAKLYEGIQPNQAARTLSRLRDTGFVEQGDRRGEWRVTDPLLRRYLIDLTSASMTIHKAGGASARMRGGGTSETA